MVYNLIIPGTAVDWLYEGPRSVKRAKFAARLMLRRTGAKVAYVRPYGFDGETFVVKG